MDQRIVEIILYVIGEIEARRVNLDEIDGISEDLIRQGFSRREVATAFSVFTHRMAGTRQRSQIQEPVNPNAYRVLHEMESSYISSEAQGHVLQLVRLGLLTHSDMEELIERCVMMGSPAADVTEMKLMVATHLFEKELLPGESMMPAASARLSPELIH
ncbi:MAG: DUF494 family protein [Calditrichaeota bacterium]|nr:DUF494 family protein [Calditrichota bacterium]MCB9391527.1 DUF494 family protein [Calditrichota bacterium]